MASNRVMSSAGRSWVRACRKTSGTEAARWPLRSAQGLLRAQAHGLLLLCGNVSPACVSTAMCCTSLDGEYSTTRIAQMLCPTPPSHTPTRPTSPEPDNLVCGLISIGIIRSFSWSAFLNQCASKRYRSVQEGQLPCKAPYSWGIRKGYIRGAA